MISDDKIVDGRQGHNKLRIFLSAGEASGDLLGASLASYILKRYPDAEIIGIGGVRMRAAGVKTLYDISDLSVIGFLEAVVKLPRLYKIKQHLKKVFVAQKIDVFCGIDYPGFNVNLAGLAKNLGISTVCYKAPSIWSWGEWRVKSVKKNVDYVAAIFPFEAAAYRKHGVQAEYVGNPIVENVIKADTSLDVFSKYDLDRSKLQILLLPGSRAAEIRNMLPVMLATAEILSANYDIQYVLPVASTINKEQIEKIITAFTFKNRLVIADGEDVYSLMKVSRCAIATSGTVTLEAALTGMPCAIIYRTSAFTYRLLKMLAKIKYVGLPNLIMDKMIFPEYLQQNCVPELIAGGIVKMLEDRQYLSELYNQFTLLRAKLGGVGAAERVAEIIIELANNRKG